ncbi:mRNA cleavage and polyadenylation factor subunit [Ciborinia camelliae]|nr:mRNA cleavage and polyadenylation factor subunit [Ciborinia camelliae]
MNLSTASKQIRFLLRINGLNALLLTIMQCYTELTPPTAVTHSLSLPFLSADASNLVVAKASLLQIFTTKTVSLDLDDLSEKDSPKAKDVTKIDPSFHDDDGVEASFLGTDSTFQRSELALTTKLVLIAEYNLSGTVTSLVRVRTISSKTGGEALLVGFKDAKLSLIEWDPERPGISTISVHFYEQDELQGSPWAPSLANCVNYLTVDPGSRCAALKFGARNLAILPFKQDEDVNMDDWDEELDGPRPAKISPKTATENANLDTPYGSSFVLRLSSLDPNLIFPIHLDFLYEYREPTFGILSSTVIPSSALLQERKDHLTYMVFTLDIHQKASTTILSVGGLPYDLFRIIPLAPPVGGALLVGTNELIHIDQAGKANGVAVNMFAKQCTSFSLLDQSDLDLRLEGCEIDQLSIENGEMLIILHSGDIAILSFRMDGRSVSGLSIRRVTSELGGAILTGAASCVSSLGAGALFVGSEVSDSVILGWSRKSGQSSRRKSRLDSSTIVDVDDAMLDEEDLEDDDDDLYGDGPTVTHAAGNITAPNSKAGDYTFRIHDSMVNIAPITNITFGEAALSSGKEEELKFSGVKSELQLVAAVGREKGGSLAVINRNIQPNVIGRFELPAVHGIWTMSAKRPAPKGLQANKEKTALSGDHGADAQYDRLMIVSKASEAEDAVDESAVYALTNVGFEALTGTEFEPAAGSTIEAGTLGNGMRVIQVLKSEVRSYDGDLGLAQILPMLDDETGAEPKIISASFADPFLLLIRDDASIFVAQCDDDNDLEEIERVDDALLSTKWLTGCLYDDYSGAFSNSKSNKAGENAKMFLLSAGGALHIYALPDLSKPVYVAEGICFVPPVLSADYAARKSAARETLTEILVADLGDSISQSPYLILRPSNDDLTIYEPFRIKSAYPEVLSSTLQFLKIKNTHLAQTPDVSAAEQADEAQQTNDKPMRAVSNLGGYSTVFMPGGSPSFIIKSSKTLPKVLCLQGTGVRSLSSFHTEGCERGFIYVDTGGITRVAQLPPNTMFADIGMALRKIEIGEDIHAVAYHAPLQTYVIGTSTFTDFELPKDDDHRKNWADEEITFKPSIEKSFLKLVSPVNWSVIDTIELEPCEIITCIKTLNLVVSEVTNERKHLIAVGTAITKGEDLATTGRLYIYDVVTVVPKPDRPETNKSLKQIAVETITRGAGGPVTGLCEIGTQGFMLVAQGQKCMVRGLKEDGTNLPVAFMDMNCYVTSIKELPGTGLCVMADALKGVWFAGYMEEPYKMLLFGKGATKMEVLCADLLPDGKDLFIVAADADGNLHIMQYDPEHPKSLQGHLLLHRTTFSLGAHHPTTMTLLPATPSLPPLTTTPTSSLSPSTQEDSPSPSQCLLLTSRTGTLALLSPLTESQYRRFGTLISHLTNTLYHPCGLNPRAYRIDKDASEGIVGGRTIIDGGVLGRWMELGSQRRGEVAGRVGVDVLELRDELSGLLGGGLGFI